MFWTAFFCAIIIHFIAPDKFNTFSTTHYKDKRVRNDNNFHKAAVKLKLGMHKSK